MLPLSVYYESFLSSVETQGHPWPVHESDAFRGGLSAPSICVRVVGSNFQACVSLCLTWKQQNVCQNTSTFLERGNGAMS